MVQSVVTMDIDFKGRMYVLDRGIEGLCSPKIVVYDLKVNKEVSSDYFTFIWDMIRV